MQDFSIGSDLDSTTSLDGNVCNRDGDLSLGQRSILKMGTVPIWERDLNLNLSQWKHVLHNTM